MLKNWDILNWENIRLIIKRHNFLYIFLWIILFIILIISIIIIFFYKTELVYLWSVFFLQFILLIIYYLYIDSVLNITIITLKKIIIINKRNLFEIDYNEFELDNIDEINVISKWLFQNIFNYWELTISIKNNSLKFKLKFVPDVINTAKNIISFNKELNKKS